MNEKKSSKPRVFNLSLIIDIWVISIFVVILIACAGIQFARNPDLAFDQLISHHMVDVTVIGIATSVLIWFILRFLLVKPLKEIDIALYRIGRGDSTPLTVKTRVKEIHAVKDAVNLMLMLTEQRAEPKLVSHALDKASHLKEHIQELVDVDTEQRTALMAHLHDLERNLTEVHVTILNNEQSNLRIDIQGGPSTNFEAGDEQI